MIGKANAWALFNMEQFSCAVVVTSRIGKNQSPINIDLSPDEARQLAKELIDSAEFIDALLKEKGMGANYGTTH